MKPVQGTFVFLAGAVVGAILILLAASGEFGELGSAQVPTQPAPTPTPQRPPRPATIADVATDATDADLASDLEEAHFDKDWGRVLAVAEALRERKQAASTAPETEGLDPVIPAGGRASVVATLRQLDRRAFRRDLALRDNLATRAMRDTEGRERVLLLSQLFSAPLERPEDQIARRDAAHFLATLPESEAQEVLIRALSGPEREQAELAAVSLARVERAESLRALARAIKAEPEPNVRLLLVGALAEHAAPAPIAAASLVTVAVNLQEEEDVRLAAIAGLARCELTRDARLESALLGLLSQDTESEAIRVACLSAWQQHYDLSRRLPKKTLQALLDLSSTSQSAPLVQGSAKLLGRASNDSTPLEATLANTRDPKTREALEAAINEIKARVTEPQ